MESTCKILNVTVLRQATVMSADSNNGLVEFEPNEEAHYYVYGEQHWTYARQTDDEDSIERSLENGSVVESLYTQLSNNSSTAEYKRLYQRQKQVDIGKNTTEYAKYCERVPKPKRSSSDPKTPNIYSNCSKRCWDGMIKKWRRDLHQYDEK
jgi:hypothetical protein